MVQRTKYVNDDFIYFSLDRKVTKDQDCKKIAEI